MGRPPKANIREAFHSDAARAKIRTAWLINRLQDHVKGKIKLELSQVRAIGVLLRKTVPDLTSTEITGEVNVRYVAHLPEPISRAAWLEKYSGDYLDPPLTIEGTTNGSGESGQPAKQSVQKLQ
jgi:hypothetical protein